MDYDYNLNRLISRVTPSETIAYQYDNNGNLITETSSISGTKTYSYDYENRLLYVASSTLTGTGTLQAAYTYSGDGRRISVDNNGTVVKYLYDAMVPVAERDASGTTLAAYTKIPQAPGGIGGLISSTDGTNTVYYHCSHLGNVNLITDAAGNVIQTYDYDAFGNIISQSGSLENEYKYKTKEYSADTGLIYFGARYYNSLIGRFITADPMGMVDGVNLYLYCGNDPVNMIDAWGECDEDYDWQGYWDRYFAHLNTYLINPGNFIGLLGLGVWPKSLAPYGNFRGPLLGSDNPFTSLIRGFTGYNSPLVQTTAEVVGRCNGSCWMVECWGVCRRILLRGRSFI